MKLPVLSACSQFWQDLPLSIKGSFVITLPLLVLLASLGSLYQREQASSLLENKLKLALQNQRDIQTIHSQLLEASTGVRDYLLTGDKHFLAIFYHIEKTLPNSLNTLKSQLENDAQQTRLSRIIPLVEQNLHDLQALSTHETDIASDQLILKFKSQVNSLDHLRKEIEQLNEEEARLVEKDQAEVFSQRQNNIVLTLIAAISGIIGSFLGVMLFSRTIVNRVRLLRNSAEHLAKAEALDLPKQSKDELGQLSDELEHASQLLAKTMSDALHAKKLAEEANASKSMFLSRTSHELRTPLNAILGFAQLLEQELVQGAQRESVARIITAGQHLLKLINEVLEIARIESSELQLELVPVNIALLIEEAVTFISPIGKIRDIEIQAECASNVWALANRQKLLQVVLNLLSNALKYGPPNATVKVFAEVNHDKVIVAVLDEGRGIPKALRDRLFTPFDRLGAENTKVEGTGLGLSLSRQLVIAMQGTIQVSEHQSLFSIILQSAPAQSTESTPTKTQTHYVVDSKEAKRILYVEDNVSNIALIEAIIKRQRNFKLDSVKSIREAKDYLHQQIPDIALIDLDLPDGVGDTLVTHIHTTPMLAHIPIIILSADARSERIDTLINMGVKAYLTKPLDISGFNKTLRDIASH